MREAVVVAVARTPVCKAATGSLAAVPMYDLGAAVIKEAVRRAKVEPAEVDDVVFGNVTNVDFTGASRICLLRAGLPVENAGITVSRNCGSSLDAFGLASALILSGQRDVIVAGGAESLSQSPYVIKRVREAYQGALEPLTGVVQTSPDYDDFPMGITAENVGKLCGVTREECDRFAHSSQMRAKKAYEESRFKDQIIAFETSVGEGKKKTVIRLDRDEIPRPDTTLEALAKLKPVFKPDGLCTAGNSSNHSDGASAVVVMEKGIAKSKGLDILGTFRNYSVAGIRPEIMGLGPVPAIKKLLAKSGLALSDIDLIEINEAFAAQTMGCVKQLGIDPDRLNVNGGAIALGHPIAGTGTILVAKMLYELRRRGARYGVISFCAGGGQGVAVLVENERA